VRHTQRASPMNRKRRQHNLNITLAAPSPALRVLVAGASGSDTQQAYLSSMNESLHERTTTVVVNSTAVLAEGGWQDVDCTWRSGYPVCFRHWRWHVLLLVVTADWRAVIVSVHCDTLTQAALAAPRPAGGTPPVS
jgi:hypothetical protein